MFSSIPYVTLQFLWARKYEVLRALRARNYESSRSFEAKKLLKALEALRARNYEALIASKYVIFSVRLKI
jgi:hypothetical protein